MNSIVIVGSGPAGACCAEFLAKNGFPVTLLEKNILPRYKPCGGAIPEEMVKEFDIPDSIIQRYFTMLVLHHIEENITLERKGRGAVLWRSDLDSYLTQRACDAGAHLQEKNKVLNVQRDQNKFHIWTETNKITSDWIIAADGANSTVLRSFNWKNFSSNEIALTITHEVKLSKSIIDERLGSDNLHIYFGKELIGIGYGWLFPKRDTISVGWGCQLDAIKHSNNQFKKFLDFSSKQLKNGRLTHKAAHLVPTNVRAFYHDRVIAIGDAAGFVDPLSGKGIIYAAWSGLIAGQILKQVLDKNRVDDLEKLYEKKLNHAFLTALKAKRKIQQDVYASNENILKFMKLWQYHRSTEIALRLWKKE
ncbi:MAG: NAD(P)/FAD-dependent oxidoreductase [Candidatus Helarchaeota archaeon]